MWSSLVLLLFWSCLLLFYYCFCYCPVLFLAYPYSHTAPYCKCTPCVVRTLPPIALRSVATRSLKLREGGSARCGTTIPGAVWQQKTCQSQQTALESKKQNNTKHDQNKSKTRVDHRTGGQVFFYYCFFCVYSCFREPSFKFSVANWKKLEPINLHFLCRAAFEPTSELNQNHGKLQKNHTQLTNLTELRR